MLNIKILTYDFVQKPQKKVTLFMGHPVYFQLDISYIFILEFCQAQPKPEIGKTGLSLLYS